MEEEAPLFGVSGKRTEDVAVTVESLSEILGSDPSVLSEGGSVGSGIPGSFVLNLPTGRLEVLIEGGLGALGGSKDMTVAGFVFGEGKRRKGLISTGLLLKNENFRRGWLLVCTRRASRKKKNITTI